MNIKRSLRKPSHLSLRKKPLIFLGSNTNMGMFIQVCKLTKQPILGILDSDYYGNTATICDLPVIGSELSFDFAENKDKFNFFVAVSVMPTIQRNKQRRLDFIQIVDNHNLQCATLIHPTANIFDTATIGAGSFVGFCSAVSSYCQIGQHCQIQSMSVIGHHSTFGHNSVLDRTAYIIGNARVGSNVNIGFGSAVVKTFATVGDNAVIHPRITVMRDVDQNEIVSLAGDNTRRIYGEIIRH